MIKKDEKTALYRAERSHDHKLVIFKTLLAPHPNVTDLRSLQDEYELLCRLPSNDVPRPLELIQNGEQAALILEDSGDVLLSGLIHKKPLNIKEFLELAIILTRTIGDLHERGIIHKDIKPNNILVNLERHTARLIDFDLVMLLPRQTQGVTNPDLLEGSLAYMSPEQTGRMNRSIDYRTDFYSLGITFYEMLVSRLPFKAPDALGMVHAHIAKKPIPLSQLNPHIPEMLDAIVLKLMSKIPEERYQSAHGLKADLEKCLMLWIETQTIPHFELGLEDTSGTFSISKKLYGREKELAILLKSYEQVSAGDSMLLLVTGYAGVGKSTLMSELHKPVIAKRGYSCNGKFDEFQQNVPYSALINALENLINQILTESEENISRWRIEFQKALGENAGVITKLIPALELIIGEQPASSTMEAAEAEKHFYWVMRNFIQVFARKEHPLVIYLDDMQWASSSSLQLISHLLKSKIHYLMIVGAYRDNEVTHNHPLKLALTELQEDYRNILTLNLMPLSLTNVENLIADTLDQNIISVKQLAKICYEKTDGNPFFLNQLLSLLNEEGFIEFDSTTNSWKWDIERITTHPVTTNVVELMIKKLTRLPEETKKILQLASCIGNSFDIKSLSTILNLSKERVTEMLWPALFEGYATAYDDSLFKKSDPSYQLCYQFVHDRIRQATYLTMDTDEKKIFHKKIGYYLLETTRAQVVENKIFEIVNHLNFSMDLLNKPEERLQLANLNFSAGQKALESVAFTQSLKHLKKAITLLPEHTWQNHYKLTQSLYTLAAEIAYITNQTVLMERYAKVALARATNALDKAKIYEIKTDAYTKTDQCFKAIHAARLGLRELGLKLPKKMLSFAISKELLYLNFLIFNKSEEDIVSLPTLQNEKIAQALRLLVRVMPSAQSKSVELLAYVSLKTVTLSIRYGNTAISAVAYMMCTLIFWRIGNFKKSKMFSAVALQIADRFHAKREKGITLFTAGAFLQPWFGHLRKSEPLLLESYKISLDTGEISYVGYNAFFYCLFKFWSGYELSETIEETKQFLEAVLPFKQNIPIPSMQLTLQMLENLHDVKDDPTDFTGSYMDEKTWLTDFGSANKLQITAYYFLKLYFNYLFGHHAKALIYEQHVQIDNFTGMYSFAMYHMYGALNRLALYNDASPKEKKSSWKKIKYNLKRLKKWSEYSPDNFLSKYYLVAAEFARIKGHDEDAISYYDQSIELAQKNKFVQEEALANELAAKFYLAKKNKKLAKLYMQEAYYAYQRWGCKPKLQQLEHLFPDLILSIIANDIAAPQRQALDVSTILKISQVISKEVVLEKLVKKTLKIMIENMGADRCVLLLESDKELFIEGEYLVGKKARVLNSIPYTEYENIPSSIIDYVKRTKQIVSIPNVDKDQLFSRDSYIILSKPKSILCSPILQHGALQGVFYFENRLTMDAFTPSRIELLKSMSAQIAISIENARLYSSFERFVPQQFLNLLEKRNVMDVKLGDSIQKSISILFMDIAGFTSMSERLQPGEVFSFMNTYLSYMEPIIANKGGFIDKYLGDGIMALFPQSADDALRAAILLQQALIDYNHQQLVQKESKILARIGVNTGETILGMLGSQHRIDGSVIGDAVNAASRIMDLNQLYGTSILISEHTRLGLDNPKAYPLRLIDQVKVKGKLEILPVWQVLVNTPAEVIPELIALYQSAREAYVQGDLTGAELKFSACLLLYPEDSVSQYFIKRCQNYIARGLPEEWDGVTTLTHK